MICKYYCYLLLPGREPDSLIMVPFCFMQQSLWTVSHICCCITRLSPACQCESRLELVLMRGTTSIEKHVLEKWDDQLGSWKRTTPPKSEAHMILPNRCLLFLYYYCMSSGQRWALLSCKEWLPWEKTDAVWSLLQTSQNMSCCSFIMGVTYIGTNP